MGYGLALSGGGARGAAHVGILKALQEGNVLPEYVAGTSSGSIVAGLYAAGISIGRMEELVVHLSQHGAEYIDPDYIGIAELLPQLSMGEEVSLTGILKGDKLERLLCDLVGGVQISQVAMRLVIPAVDLRSGNTIAFTNSPMTRGMEHVEWSREGELCRIIMASCSVPAVFRPRKMGDYCLVDGGVSNNLPVDLLIHAGVPNVIGVDIGANYEASHEKNIIEVVSHSFSIMSRNLKDCMSMGEILLLKPVLEKGAGLLSFATMVDSMQEGYEYGKSMIPQIKKAAGE